MIRREYGLPTVSVRLGRPGRAQGAGATAIVEVQLGKEPAIRVAEVPLADLGVPERVTSAADVAERRFRMDAGLAGRIRDALTALAPDAEAYWLELPSPRGYLHLVPWERLLSPTLDRPLIRLPYSILRPQAPGSITVVLVASRPGPDTLSMVQALVGAWQRSTHHRVLVEVFVEQELTPTVRERLAALAGVSVHDPGSPSSPAGIQGPGAGGPVPGNGERPGAAPIGHPWLDWVAAALAGRAADVVHLLGRGSMIGDRGSVVLAAVPQASEQATWDRAVNAAQLLELSTRLGAWCSVLSGAPSVDNTGEGASDGVFAGDCPAARRDLGEALAQARPGVVIVHDLDPADPGGQLWLALSLLYGGESMITPLPAISSWSHPEFVRFPDLAVGGLCTEDGRSALLSSVTQEALAREQTPAWVAAGARALETLQAQWAPPGGPPPSEERRDALLTVSRIFEEHVRDYGGPEGGPSPGAPIPAPGAGGPPEPPRAGGRAPRHEGQAAS